MEAVNESSMLIAKALDRLKYFQSLCEGEYDHSPEVDESVKLLETALEKLVATI